jgi:hypothetical protein
MGNEGPPALNTTKLNRRNRRELMSLMSRSRDEDQRFDPPLTAVWTANATHHSRRSLI